MRAATIAGDPNPCVMSEKCVRWRWIVGSRICWGRVLQSGERSWFKRSINSLVITLKNKTLTICQNCSTHNNNFESGHSHFLLQFVELQTQRKWKDKSCEFMFNKIELQVRTCKEKWPDFMHRKRLIFHYRSPYQSWHYCKVVLQLISYWFTPALLTPGHYFTTLITWCHFVSWLHDVTLVPSFFINDYQVNR